MRPLFICQVGTLTELGTGVGVGVGDGFAVGVGLGLGLGVATGLGVGAGAAEEAPTLPQPEIIRMAAAEAMTAGVLKRQMKASVAMILADTRRRANSLGIDECLILDERERGNGATAFASFSAHNDVQNKIVCC